MSLRGETKSGDHVDIMGNLEMIQDLLKVVSNHADPVEERILSNIREISDRITLVESPNVMRKRRESGGV